MNQTHVRDVPVKEARAFVHQKAIEDPAHVYFAQTVPPGYDAEADRVRKLGMVQVFKCERVAKVRNVDRQLHHLVRRG